MWLTSRVAIYRQSPREILGFELPYFGGARRLVYMTIAGLLFYEVCYWHHAYLRVGIVNLASASWRVKSTLVSCASLCLSASIYESNTNFTKLQQISCFWMTVSNPVKHVNLCTTFSMVWLNEDLYSFILSLTLLSGFHIPFLRIHNLQLKNSPGFWRERTRVRAYFTVWAEQCQTNLYRTHGFGAHPVRERNIVRRHPFPCVRTSYSLSRPPSVQIGTDRNEPRNVSQPADMRVSVGRTLSRGLTPWQLGYPRNYLCIYHGICTAPVAPSHLFDCATNIDPQMTHTDCV